MTSKVPRTAPCRTLSLGPLGLQVREIDWDDQLWRSQDFMMGRVCPSPVSTGIGPSHCPNGRLGQDLGFGGFAFSLKLPELLNTNLQTVRAKLGQRYSFPNGPQIWCPTRQ